MSKQASLFFFFLLLRLIGLAQDIPVKVVPTEIFRSVKKDPNDTLNWNWKRGGIINLNLAQGSLSNWAAGGDKFSLAVIKYIFQDCLTFVPNFLMGTLTPGTAVHFHPHFFHRLICCYLLDLIISRQKIFLFLYRRLRCVLLLLPATVYTQKVCMVCHHMIII